ncbi:hypothetical protein N656DRAFT_779584 [Canariomyces notabilis]|uniref:Uncharacterized protein n=1 Tax=Canariomyces notabilis TaxID=2074819 RepID=A0AAN6TCX8_9PEZI|nr:hypothetical protein N656DRAFT_779584 [Canariomyces arenarius]
MFILSGQSIRWQARLRTLRFSQAASAMEYPIYLTSVYFGPMHPPPVPADSLLRSVEKSPDARSSHLRIPPMPTLSGQLPVVQQGALAAEYRTDASEPPHAVMHGDFVPQR